MKLPIIVVSAFIGALVVVLCAAITAATTLALMALVVTFCIMFSLTAPYIIIAAVLWGTMTAAMLVVTLYKYVKSIKAPPARTGTQPSAPAQPQAK